MWTKVLLEAGVDVTAVAADEAMLRWRGQQRVLPVVTVESALWPSRLQRAPQVGALLVAPRASTKARARAKDLGWSLVLDDGSGWIRFGDDSVLELPEQQARSDRPQHRRAADPAGVAGL